MFAVVLCMIFAGLLAAVFYFLRLNVSESQKAIYESQSIYLAESGNARAMARLNVKTLPDDEGLYDDDEEESQDTDSEEEITDEEMDELDLDEDEGEDDISDDSEERKFLLGIPRYINFYLKNPFFVNIDTGAIITEAQYYAMVAQQQQRIQLNKSQSQERGENYDQQELLIEELYFPLPEVNVRQIGTIKFEKGTHLKPGFRIVLAQKVPVKLKQPSIVEEYLNQSPSVLESLPRPILKALSPNFASPGDYLDVYCEGENLDDYPAEFSSAGITVYEGKCPRVSIAIKEDAKPGKYKVKVGPNRAEFFIVPSRTDAPVPIINDIIDPKGIIGVNQFTKMLDKQKIDIKITGLGFGTKNPPLIVPDASGITVEIVSFKDTEIVCSIATNRADSGAHYLSIFTEGGQSNSWVFNVEKDISAVANDPNTGTYSTVLTLLEVNSLANLPIKSILEIDFAGRPQGDASIGTDKGDKRPESSDKPTNKKKSFDLLRSDLETVWKLETIATVNGINYKETKIIRRNVPRLSAAITTNTGLSFGQSSVVIAGVNLAQTRLEESSSGGDTTIFVEGDGPDKDLFKSRDEETKLTPTGEAVVEDFGFNRTGNSPASKGFTPGSIVTIVGLSRRNTYSDFSFVESTGPNTITVRDPGFSDSHFIGDDVFQIIPSVITPMEMSDRDSQRNLNPPGSFVNIPDLYFFEYVFRTRLDKIAEWTGGVNTDLSVPSDIENDYDGYFGLNIISGEPSYSGANTLYGQGALIVDTTQGGLNPAGGTVTLGGSSKLPSIFDGVIYIIGKLQVSGPVAITGGIVVYSPEDRGTVKISGSGDIKYEANSIKKAILHLPFAEELRTRVLEKSKGQEEILKK